MKKYTGTQRKKFIFKQSLNVNAYENNFLQVECKNGNKNYETFETSCNCYF
jgi:hypothetical protein